MIAESDLSTFLADATAAEEMAEKAPAAPWRHDVSQGCIRAGDGTFIAMHDSCAGDAARDRFFTRTAFALAARTGWPRDAARVKALVEALRELEQRLEQAQASFSSISCLAAEGPDVYPLAGKRLFNLVQDIGKVAGEAWQKLRGEVPK